NVRPGLAAAVGKRRKSGPGGPPFGSAWCSLDQLLMELATELNFEDALLPSSVMAAMQTTAISATRRAYSTSEAPRSSSKRARSQVARNSNLVIIVIVLPMGSWWC